MARCKLSERIFTNADKLYNIDNLKCIFGSQSDVHIRIDIIARYGFIWIWTKYSSNHTKARIDVCGSGNYS